MNCVEFFRQKGISLVWAMRYSPCDRKKNVNGRQYNSFLYMESGRYLLTFADGRNNLSALAFARTQHKRVVAERLNFEEIVE